MAWEALWPHHSHALIHGERVLFVDRDGVLELLCSTSPSSFPLLRVSDWLDTRVVVVLLGYRFGQTEARTHAPAQSVHGGLAKAMG
jgi:hypothetical protein